MLASVNNSNACKCEFLHLCKNFLMSCLEVVNLPVVVTLTLWLKCEASQ